MRLSLVIPAFNEEAKIGRDIAAAFEFLSGQAFDSEVLIVNDGSRDRTVAVAEENFKKYPAGKVHFRVLDYGENRGKGYAVRYGVKEAKGEIIAFADAGLCVPYRFLLSGIAALEAGADYAIASRRIAGTKIQKNQPFYRKAGSKVFWYVVQWGMGVDVSDTQCGFKLYKRDAAKKIFANVQTDGFMFDIEALMIAKRLGLKAAEFAIEWSNDGDTRYHPIWGTIRNFKELSRIRVRSFLSHG
jgi:dolichyl-phosphate beta-glucosyltransferase